MKYFSPSVTGFFDDTKNQKIPKDCIPLSDERYNELFENQRKGFPIIFSGDTVSNKVFTVEDERDMLLATFRQLRKNVVNMIMEAKVLNDPEPAELTAAIQSIRVLLKNKKAQILASTEANMKSITVEGAQIKQLMDTINQYL